MKIRIPIIFAVLLSIFALAMYMFTVRGEFGNAENPKGGDAQTLVGGVFESSHERAPYAFMLSLLERKTVVLTKDLADFGSPDVGFIKDKFYSYFPIGISALIAPLYLLGYKYNLGLLGAYATMPLIAIATLVALYGIARRVLQLPAWSALVAALVFGFATTSWSYAITIYQHQVSAFCMVVGFYCVWSYAQRTSRAWVWSALFAFIYGLSVFVDYPNALLLAPLGIYFLYESFDLHKAIAGYQIKIRASLVLAGLIFTLITAGHLYYNQTQLGSWNRFHNTLPRYTTETYAAAFADSEAEAKRKDGAAQVFHETNIIHGTYELFVAPDKGVFFFSPILLLAFLGLYYAFKKSTPAIATLGSLAAVNFFVYASFGDPWGGWAYGPRYVIPAMAMLALFVAYGLAKAKYSLVARAVAFLLVLYSSAVALLGVVTTNLVPPKIEADYFHLKYNFLRNIDFLKLGTTKNFIYSTYLHNQYSLETYFWFLYSIVVFVFFMALFVLPLVKEKRNV